MKGSEEMDEMTKSELAALIEWLREHGHDAVEIVECLEYISNSR